MRSPILRDLKCHTILKVDVNIKYSAMTHCSDAAGNVDSFTASVTPEPLLFGMQTTLIRTNHDVPSHDATVVTWDLCILSVTDQFANAYSHAINSHAHASPEAWAQAVALPASSSSTSQHVLSRPAHAGQLFSLLKLLLLC